MNTENLLGIETLKKDVTIVCRVIGATDKALADGKINLLEGFDIGKNAIGLITIAKNWKDAKAEAMDINSDEMTELVEHIAREFDIRNDAAEKMVETAISVIVSLGSAILATREAA